MSLRIAPYLLRPAARLAALAIALLGIGLAVPAHAVGAGFTEVTFARSGGPGAWVLDFTVLPINRSNMEIQSFIGSFTIGVEGGTPLDQPAGYSVDTSGGVTDWRGTRDVLPRLKLAVAGIGGFRSLVTSAAAPTDVAWTVRLDSGTFLNDFYVGGDVYAASVTDRGVAHLAAVLPAVPEPSASVLMLLGLAALPALRRVRRHTARHPGRAG